MLSLVESFLRYKYANNHDPRAMQVNAHYDTLLSEDVSHWDHLLSNQLILAMECLVAKSGEEQGHVDAKHISVDDGRVLRCYGSTQSQRAFCSGTGWRFFSPLTLHWSLQVMRNGPTRFSAARFGC